jgi:glycosyltransferase involved in cell wall biosynthesis
MNNQTTTSSKNSWLEISDNLLLPAKPVVSVLMITYNHELYLTEAINGILEQTVNFSYEIIIGEDYSTDKTRAIALDFQRRFPSVVRVVFSENNVGMHNNFLRTLNLCNGEFIAFCEGDDYWTDTNKLQTQVDYLRSQPNIGLCFHPVYSKSTIDSSASEVICYHGEKNIEIPASELVKNGGAFCPSCSLVMRSEKIKHNSWLMQDLPVADYFIQVLSAFPNGAGYVGRVMGVYRRDIQGSFSSEMKLWKKRLRLNKSLLDKLDEFSTYLKGSAANEINYFKKKIYFSLMRDVEIAKSEKIFLLFKCKCIFNSFEILKISGMIFFPNSYKLLVNIKNIFSKSSWIKN